MTRLTPDQCAELAQVIAAHRQALTVLAGEQWRPGRTLGATVYAATGGDNYKEDAWIGDLHTPELAEQAIADHNAILNLGWLLDAGFTVKIEKVSSANYAACLDHPDRETTSHLCYGSPPEVLAEARTWAEGEGYAP